MPLPSSGSISLNEVNVELGAAGTTTRSLNDSAVRTLFGVASGAISMSNGYGKANRVTVNITISANTANYTLNTAKATGYSAGRTDVILTINSGVIVSSGSTGTAAFIVDTSWAAGDTVRINNNGTILGRGGNGGAGGYAIPGAGTGGGLALSVQRATSINNANRISGGGGGGGGGSYGLANGNDASGGGGGGGIGNGSNGLGGSGAGHGTAGTLTANGTGGAGGQRYVAGTESSPDFYVYGGSGGNGGTYGSAGAAGGGGTHPYTAPGNGGGAGAAVSGNGNITWIATGTRNGGIA